MLTISTHHNRLLVNIITKNPAPSNDFNTNQLIDICQSTNQLPITTTLRITQSPIQRPTTSIHTLNAHYPKPIYAIP